MMDESNSQNIEKPLILFDVDGTLIRGSRLHFKAFYAVFKEMFNKSLKISWEKNAGKTDQWIIHDLLVENDIPEEEISEKMDEIIKKMVDYYCNHLDEETGYVLPGVNEILQYLKERGAYLGLVTGNLEQIAHHKIWQIGVRQNFDFGGFGNEDWDRSVFMKYAIEKAIRLYHLDPDYAWTHVYYVGDTPYDVSAAKTINIKSIIVGTGYYKLKDFNDNLPDLYIENFSDSEEIRKFLDFIGYDENN